jgi:outer membrane protein assembly factor BamA
MLEVTQIDIRGNQQTRETTILRELDFKVGDSILQAHLPGRFERNKNNLLNTALFTEAELNIAEWNVATGQIIVTVDVKEAWYIYVVPIVELADRNFNVWVQEHDAEFSRLNLGIRAIHINLSGIRDRLKVKGQVGYTRKFETEYQLPYFNRDKTLGLHLNLFMTANREVAYLSEGNKEVYYRDDNSDVFKRLRVQAGVQFRPNLYFQHEFEASYHRNRIAHQIAVDNNPDFFLKQRTKQEFIGLRYKAEYDKRNLKLFPTQGFLLSAEIMKDGIGLFDDINNLSLTSTAEYYLPVSNTVNLGFLARGEVGLIREKQPFWNYLALGSGRDYLRGYELYVINGLDYAYEKSSLRIRLLDTGINWGRRMPRHFREMPVQIYTTLNLDVGYVNDPFYDHGNPLVNRFIFGWGPGVSLLLFHMFAIHVEYNVNDLGENGLFLHSKTSF